MREQKDSEVSKIVRINKNNRNEIHSKKGKPLLIMVFFFIFIIGGYLFLSSSFFDIKEISVEGVEQVLQSEIIDSISIKNENIWRYNRNILKKQLLNNPYIKNVTILRKLPSTFIVRIVERKPIATILVEDGYILLSEDGVFLKIVNAEEINLPEITGLQSNLFPGPGQKVINGDMLDALKILTLSEGSLFSKVSEIRIEKDYFLVLVDGIKLIIGKEMNNILLKGKFSEVNTIIEQVIGRQILKEEVDYLDLRYANEVIIKKIE